MKFSEYRFFKIILKVTILYLKIFNVLFLVVLPNIFTISICQILCQSKLHKVKFVQNKNNTLLISWFKTCTQNNLMQSFIVSSFKKIKILWC